MLRSPATYSRPASHSRHWILLRWAVLICAAFSIGGDVLFADEGPRSLDERVQIQLFAEHPVLVTPTGIDVDRHGRVFVIESNTHFPPKDYARHPSDRLLVLEDQDNDGKSDQATVIADGFRHAMSVLVLPIWHSNIVGLAADAPPRACAVLVATRRSIWLLIDGDGDTQAESRRELITLDTPGDYPHNGLAGFALHGDGWLYFGFGENLGANYKINGTDGLQLEGGGEGGNLYRCRLDGTHLEQVATGFWNPHASAFDGLGRLFTVDNDPDSRPPCRLMHVTRGADFGYRFRNGRKGLHPFTAWNGELPGTLPMTAGTGEAPSGIIACESTSLPDDYVGQLLVTSWGDHRIDRFELKPRGSSFQSLARPLIVGGSTFRPVGLATGPDGSLFASDWVLPDYNLHQQGRVWRISRVDRKRATKRPSHLDVAKLSVADQTALVRSAQLETRRLAARTLMSTAEGQKSLKSVLLSSSESARTRHEALWALLDHPSVEPLSQKDVEQLLLPESGLATTILEHWGAPLIPKQPAAVERLVVALVDERLGSRKFPSYDPTALVPALEYIDLLRSGLLPKLTSLDDPAVFSSLVNAIARSFSSDDLAALVTPGVQRLSSTARLAGLLAARKKFPQDESIASLGLAIRDPRIRQAAVQWVAEEKLTQLRPAVDRVFRSKDVTSELFLATIAALAMLDGQNPADIDRLPASQYVLPLARNAELPATVRGQALRLVGSTDKELTTEFFDSLWSTSDVGLQREALRTWQIAKGTEIQERLLTLAKSKPEDPSLQFEAIMGLGYLAQGPNPQEGVVSLLVELLKSDDIPVVIESLRTLRVVTKPETHVVSAVETLGTTLAKGSSGEPTSQQVELAAQIGLLLELWKIPVDKEIDRIRGPRPQSKEDWVNALGRGRGGNPETGRRAFFHIGGAGCAKCHTIGGRGGHVGPDLTRAVETMNRMQMMLSVLDPSGEIAPQFVAWTMEMSDGKTHTGMIVHENEGKTILGDADGKTIELKTADIEQRIPQKTSVMPAQLFDRMTVQEVRDVLSFLEKGSP